MSRKKVAIITGPTATGKSSLAVRLCGELRGSIINADSVQVYKYLNIGTAKPTKDEMGGIPHYLIDELDPKEPFCAADFMKAALRRIEKIHSRGRRVFIVGGTGLYIRALTGGLIGGSPPVPAIRAELRARAEKEGTRALYDELKSVDAASAQRIEPNDLFRIIRALELYRVTGSKPCELRQKHSFKESEFLTLKIGLTLDRDKLYKRIEARVDRMIAGGLEDEVRRLTGMGYTKEHKPLTSIGYKQMMMYITGEIDLDEAVRLIKRDTKRYAKRQLTWFKKEEDILWHDAEKAATDAGYLKIMDKVASFFGRGKG